MFKISLGEKNFLDWTGIQNLIPVTQFQDTFCETPLNIPRGSNKAILFNYYLPHIMRALMESSLKESKSKDPT